MIHLQGIDHMRNEFIPKALKEYRKKNNYTVNDVSLLLQKRSLEVAPKTIYGWESGQASPSADMLLTLCEIYHITDVLGSFGHGSSNDFQLTLEERTVVEAYRAHPELHEAVDILLGCRKHSSPDNRNMRHQA